MKVGEEWMKLKEYVNGQLIGKWGSRVDDDEIEDEDEGRDVEGEEEGEGEVEEEEGDIEVLESEWSDWWSWMRGWEGGMLMQNGWMIWWIMF